MLSRIDAQAYATKLIARQRFDWDTIAEGHPSGEILEQEDCELVREALESCTVVLLWDDASMIMHPDER